MAALVVPWLAGLNALCVAVLMALQLLLSRRLRGLHAHAWPEWRREKGSGSRSAWHFLSRAAYRSYNGPKLDRLAFWITWGVRLVYLICFAAVVLAVADRVTS